MPNQVPISVVLPVHRGVTPDHLRACLDSVYGQTHAAQEVIVVEDGPLEPGHRAVLDSFAQSVPVMRRVRLEDNRGAGVANQTGLLAATGEWIAKMDADDICLPGRFERQVEIVRELDDIDVCGAAMAEFEDDEERVTAIRRNPATHEAIARRMRTNNPINHSTAFFRRSVAVQAGGYSDLRFMQDYDMFARILAAGGRMMNLQEPLVLFRADARMYRRRSSHAMNRCELQLQGNLHRYGVISWPRSRLNLVIRLLFRRLPPRVLRWAYRVLFHSHADASQLALPGLVNRCSAQR